MNNTRTPKKLLAVFGTRPEAVKMAPVVIELGKDPDFDVRVILTGQHREMLYPVLRAFALQADGDMRIMKQNQTLTDISIGVLKGMEEILLREEADMTLVHGDTSTSAVAAFAAHYFRVPVAHIEAGLRSGDRFNPFPEEMNRRITDAIAELHLAPTEGARKNLLREGVDPTSIFVTGNTAVDALLCAAAKPLESGDSEVNRIIESPDSGPMILMEIHRRENFGEPMRGICRAVARIVSQNKNVSVVFPVHKNPNVREAVYAELQGLDRVTLLEPVDYFDFVHLMKKAYLILTDSGGIQEEAPSLDTPALVARTVTERPEAVDSGAVRVVGVEPDQIVYEIENLLRNRTEYQAMRHATNPFGDGRAASRICAALRFHFGLDPDRPEDFRS